MKLRDALIGVTVMVVALLFGVIGALIVAGVALLALRVLRRRSKSKQASEQVANATPPPSGTG